MITEKGQLPIGIEFEGKVHKDFELRPQKVKDSVEALEDNRAQKNDAYFGLSLLAKQIVVLGNIPKDKITPELILEFYEEDLRALHAAKERLQQRLISFRGEEQKH